MGGINLWFNKPNPSEIKIIHEKVLTLNKDSIKVPNVLKPTNERTCF